MSYLSSPNPNSGRDLGGERVRVLLKSEGVAVVAAIELTNFPRSDARRADLNEEFDQLRSNVQTAFERQKFKVNLTPTRALGIRGQSALATELSVVGDAVHLVQGISVAQSPQFLFFLTFAASEQNYSNNSAQFDAVKQSITLQ